jgi:hypothetical protein
MRAGRREMWTAGLPWSVVNEAIDTSFEYTVSEDCKSAWKSATGRAWDNTEDSMTKSLKCPACSEQHEIPWTTCGLPEDSKGPRPGIVGEGFGDGKFNYTCFKCGTLINSEFLQVAKFVKDVSALLAKDQPMPGTILYYKTGMPENITTVLKDRLLLEQQFPNRLIKGHLRSNILELVQPGKYAEPVTMENVRVMVENAIKDPIVIHKIEGISGVASMRSSRLTMRSRIPTRKMMSHYWGNFSPFALELGGAVLRQGIFVDKMYKVCGSLLTFIEAEC